MLMRPGLQGIPGRRSRAGRQQTEVHMDCMGFIRQSAQRLHAGSWPTSIFSWKTRFQGNSMSANFTFRR